MTELILEHTRTRLRKRNVSITIGLVALALFISSLFTANASSAEYLQLTARGSSMYPTIRDGDRLTVQICVNGSLINVGDIISYSTIATGADLNYMWIGHRVIDKYRKDGRWYFKTKGDNNPEPDPWEVPEYALLGIVVNIEHTEKSSVQKDTSAQPARLEGTQTLLIVYSVVLGATMAVFRQRRKKQMSILRKANSLSCYTCRHYQIQYMYRTELINGRIGIRKVKDFSAGFCKRLNRYVWMPFPRRNCKHYEPKTYT